MPASDHPTIIAFTSEDDELVAVRKRGEALARQRDATLILYDVDTGDPLEGSPLPTNWSAEGTDERVPDRLSPQDLEKAGRAALAEQVRVARLDGLDAWGWLPDRPDAIRDYAVRVRADLVLVPDRPDKNGFVEKITGRTPTKAAREDAPPGVEVEVIRT